MSAVGGLFQGLRQGIETGQQVRRNRRIEKVLDREADEYDLNRSGMYDAYINEGGDPSDFPEFEDDRDPFLFRTFDWFKQKFGGGGQQAAAPSTALPTMSDGGMARRSATRQAIPVAERFAYADGGRVDEEDDDTLTKIGVGAGAVAASNPRAIAGAGRAAARTGAGAGRLAGRAVRMAGRIPGANRVAPAIAAIPVVDQLDEDYDDRIAERFGWGGPTPEDGEASLGGFAKFFGKRLLGYASDVGGMIPGVKSLYRDSQSDVAAQPSDATVEKTALPPDTAAAAAAAGGNKEQPAEDVAAQALQTGANATPGHPQGEDQDFDWAAVAEAGGSPDEIPHVGVGDWADYRKRHVLASIKQGKSAAEAHEEVDQIQMRGMMSNLNQAAYLLQAGNAKGAALAARAAYQYFPNGADVRFGIHQGKDGAPILVGMGTDEESGEPIMEGKPMVLTPELLHTMAENFSNPAAFRTWTKDWRDQAFKDREYNEVTVPEAQSEAIYRDRAGRAALGQAAAAQERAVRSSSGGGVRESDFRASFDRMADEFGISAEVEPEDVEVLRTLGTRLRQRYPSQGDLSDEQIMEYLMDAYRTGDLSTIEQALEQ